MRTIVFISLFLILYSCGNRKATTQTAANTTIPQDSIKTDTAKTQAKDSTQNQEKDIDSAHILFERGHIESPQYSISLINEYDFTNGKPHFYDSSQHMEGTFLKILNKTNNKVDTLWLETDSYGDGGHMVVKDLTDSLQVKPLLLELVYYGDDDKIESLFVGYKNNKLKQLFQLEDFGFDTEGGVKLVRLNQSTLGTQIGGHVDLTNTAATFSVEIPIKDYSIHYVAAWVGHITTATRDFTSIRMIDDTTASNTEYQVKKGAKVSLEMLYPERHKVRLIISDSIKVLANTKDVKVKKMPNGNAG